MSGIVLDRLVKQFGDDIVIPELSLSIDEGEFVVIVGPSGCGKSTTLRMIAGLEEVSGGSIHIAGRDVTRIPPKARDIAMVFQSHALYPHMNVADSMSFALQPSRTPIAEIRDRVQRAAEMLERAPCLDRTPKDLSGGQRQRVAVGRSIVRDAYCFLFDEPFSNLDAELRASMRTELSILHRKLDRTMIYATHDKIEAMSMAGRVAIMESGRIRQVGTPREVYNAPDNLFVAGFIGSPSMNFLDAELTGGDPVRVQGDGFEMPLRAELSARARKASSRRVTVGLRPEHFSSPRLPGRFMDAALAPVRLAVDVAEYIGSSQFLAARIGDKPVAAAIAVGPDSLPMQSGEFSFDTNRLYLFDAESGQSI